MGSAPEEGPAQLPTELEFETFYIFLEKKTAAETRNEQSNMFTSLI